MLIFVGWVPPCLDPSGACLGLHTRVGMTAASQLERGLRQTGAAPRALSSLLSDIMQTRPVNAHPLCGEFHFPCDCPYEGCQLPCNGGDGHIRVLSQADERAIALTESHLSFPGNVLDFSGEVLLSFPYRGGHPGGEAVSPCALDDRPAGMAVAGLGDATLTAFLTAGVLTGRQSQVCHELPWGVEAADVAEFGCGRNGHDLLNTPEGLHRIHHRSEAPGLHLFAQALLNPTEAFHVLGDGAEVLLVDDLLCRGGARDTSEVAQVGIGPRGPAF